MVALVPFANDEGYRYAINGMHHNEKGMPDLRAKYIDSCITRINDKVELNQEDIFDSEKYMCEDAEYLIVAYGSVARSAKEAVKKLREEGIRAGLYRPITIWPFNYKEVGKYGDQVKSIVVAELNRGQMYHMIVESVGKDTVVKKLNIINGSIIKPEDIIESVKETENVHR